MITGFLTRAGEQMVSQNILSGVKYTVQAIYLGMSDTKASDTAPKGVYYGMVKGAAYKDMDGVEVLPVSLDLAGITAKGVFSEILVYAKQDGGVDKLFKIYKLGEKSSVTTPQPMVLKFLLYDKDVSLCGDEIMFKPGELATAEMVKNVYLNRVESVGLAMSGEQCLKFISQLGEYVDKDYVIAISDSNLNGVMEIKGKYGPGSITFDGKGTATTFDKYTGLRNKIIAEGCGVPISFRHFRAVGEGLENGDVQFALTNCKEVTFEKCRFSTFVSSHFIKGDRTNVTFINSFIANTSENPNITLTECDFKINHTLAESENNIVFSDFAALHLKGCKMLCTGQAYDNSFAKCQKYISHSLYMAPTSATNNNAVIKIY